MKNRKDFYYYGKRSGEKGVANSGNPNQVSNQFRKCDSASCRVTGKFKRFCGGENNEYRRKKRR